MYFALYGWKEKDCVIKIYIAGRLENGKLVLIKAVFVGFYSASSFSCSTLETFLKILFGNAVVCVLTHVFLYAARRQMVIFMKIL